MRQCWSVAAVLFACCSARVMAQDVDARAGAGVAAAGGVGGEAMIAGAVGVQRFVARMDVRMVAAGRSAGYVRTARTALWGLAAGYAASDGNGRRTYVLLGAAYGLDVRESDRVRALGVMAGIDHVHGTRLFIELRAERWWQYGPRHYELPAGVLALVGGVVID